MKPRILVDFHHSSLLRSLIMLFEDRLGYEVYRPIGMDWFTNGFWNVYPHPDTAKQYLSIDQRYHPVDGSPQLNKATEAVEGVYDCADPDGIRLNRGCTLDYFKSHKFDIILASIPAHVAPYRVLRERYQPEAKLIFQSGNDWLFGEMLDDWNVLSSNLPREQGHNNVHYYHQEFPLDTFSSTSTKPTNKVYSFINAYQQQFPVGWRDFKDMEVRLPEFDFKSYGGQCRDGNMQGIEALANKMREAQFIFHVKDSGDGFGHILYNAYAVGRPVIIRPSHYLKSLAAELLVPGTFIDLDVLGVTGAKKEIRRLHKNPEELKAMGLAARRQFNKVVDYNQEAREIQQWLKSLN